MDFKVETLGPCRKKIAVVIPPERIGEEYDKKYDEINEAVAMPGFRPGKAPRKLLERRFSERLGDEIKNDLVKAALEELFEDEEQKVQPLAPPDIDIEALELDPSEPFEFDFELVTQPEFETPAYKELEVKVPPVEVSDEEVDTQIEQLLRRSATLETVEDGKVEDDDVLIVDWQALDGDSVEARDTGAYYPYGRGVLAGFVAESLDEQLAGKQAGAEATATVQVAADDPREELRDRELELKVTLKEIKRYELPPLDEKFLEKHDYDDEDELREDMQKRIERAKSRQRDGMAEQLLVEQLLDGVEISLPEDFVEKELENWALRKRMSLQMEKVEDDEIAKQIDAARDDTKAAIERDMQRHFLLERIAKEEEIEVTEAEMVQSIEEIATAYGHPVEQVAAQFRDQGRLAELQSEIRQRKARGAIRATANLVEDPSMLEEDAGADDKAAKKKASKKKAAKKKTAKKKAAKKKAE
ncbi:MAG: trigger factor [Planctomycetota bacterium]|nr:trigger factor [Planctomycetota bacterium]